MNAFTARPLLTRIYVNTVGFLDISKFYVGIGPVEITGGWSYKPCDIAVMYGLPNPPRTSPQGRLRNAIHREHRGPVIVVESSIVGRAFLPRKQTLMRRLLRRPARPQQHHPYFRVGVGGALGDDADFGAHNSPSDRWQMMREQLGIDVRPYRSEGDHILVVGQVAKDASLRGMDITWWLIDTVNKIRRVSARPVVVRFHPSMKASDGSAVRSNLAEVEKVSFSPPGRQMRHDLDNAWCCVTYSSGAAIDALIAGVPPICMSPASLGYNICSRNLEDVAYPLLPRREQFFNDLAYSQWSLDEIANGTAWTHIWPTVMSAMYRSPALSPAERNALSQDTA